MMTRKFDKSMIPEIGRRTMEVYKSNASEVFSKAYKAGNHAVINDEIVSKAKAPAGFLSTLNTLTTSLWFAMSDYTTMRRYVIAGGTVDAETEKDIRDTVFTCWKRMLSFDKSLHATAADTEMLWLAMEKFVDNKPGQNTPKVFARLVQREIGVRLEKLESMTPELTQYKERTRTVKRSLSAAKRRTKDIDEQIAVLKALNLEGADASVSAFIKDALAKAQEDAEKNAETVESLQADLDTLTEEIAAAEVQSELYELGFTLQ